jgi:hypothetical protein
MTPGSGGERCPKRVWGVDFSGAKDAGKKIWIARGDVRGGIVEIERCDPARELPGFKTGRDDCLAALCEFVAGEGECVLGFDFPFGLPEKLVKERTWEEFVAAFPTKYADPESFKSACRSAACERELKRLTDKECQSPFSPYNLRLYRQTYYGMRDFLGPIVARELTCVIPMQRPVPGKPWVLEVCPAATLKREGLYVRDGRPVSYKKKTEKHREARRRILEGIERPGVLRIGSQEIREKVLDDSEGDGLDSVIAALAAFRAVLSGEVARRVEKPYVVEGWTFV